MLQRVSGVIERRQTLPVLANLLLEVTGDQLVMTGSDGEIEMTMHTSASSCQEPGDITVPARKLLDICKSLPDGANMEFRSENHRLAVNSGSFQSFLATLPATDFPRISTGEEQNRLEISSESLRSALERTAFAMAQQDVRYFFNGMLFEMESSCLRVVATNGQRLATSVIEIGDHSPGRFIVPRKAVQELLHILQDPGKVILSFASNHLLVTLAATRFVTTLIDATYPDYQRAIPAEGTRVLVGDRVQIREALVRTAILSNEVYKNIRLKMGPGKLEMHSNNPQQEEAEELVSVDYTGEDLEIGFNVNYLIDALSAMEGDRVRIVFTDVNSACLLTDPDDIHSRYVISPMML